MLIIHMPMSFRIGDRASVRINLKPASIWWRDAETFVVNDTDERRILDRSAGGRDLQCFICSDADVDAEEFVNPFDGLLYAVKPSLDEPRYWIAINGASCTRTCLPLRHPHVSPTPERLFGFRTEEEACEAQRICLKEPLATVRQWMRESLWPAVESGAVTYIRPAHPQPPTNGPTCWTDSPDVHAVMQSVLAPDDVN